MKKVRWLCNNKDAFFKWGAKDSPTYTVKDSPTYTVKVNKIYTFRFEGYVICINGFAWKTSILDFVISEMLHTSYSSGSNLLVNGLNTNIWSWRTTFKGRKMHFEPWWCRSKCIRMWLKLFCIYTIKNWNSKSDCSIIITFCNAKPFQMPS